MADSTTSGRDAHAVRVASTSRLPLHREYGQTKAGRTNGNDLAAIFQTVPDASLCFDIGHARQIDPTMSQASAILHRFRDRIRQLHVSEVNTQSRHDCLSFESVLAFRKVAHLVPADVPVILESGVEESEINGEVQSALNALSANNLLALAGD